MRSLIALTLLTLPALSSSPIEGDCPRTCQTVFSLTSSSGSLTSPDWVLVAPSGGSDGNGALVGGQGGITCTPCTQCYVQIGVSWSIADKCLTYNGCGVLEQGGGSGSRQIDVFRDCGTSVNFTIRYGQCDPLYDGDCTPPLVVMPAQYTATYTFTCNSCS